MLVEIVKIDIFNFYVNLTALNMENVRIDCYLTFLFDIKVFYYFYF